MNKYTSIEQMTMKERTDRLKELSTMEEKNQFKKEWDEHKIKLLNKTQP